MFKFIKDLMCTRGWHTWSNAHNIMRKHPNGLLTNWSITNCKHCHYTEYSVQGYRLTCENEVFSEKKYFRTNKKD